MEILADFNTLCGECPLWDPESQTLYWTDCVGKRFFQAGAAAPALVSSGFEVNGFRLNEGGGFVVANSGGLWLWKPAEDPVAIVAACDGNRLQLNDCVSDRAGRLIAGSQFYDPGAEYPLGKLFRIDCDGSAAVLDEGFHLANGLAFSPEGGTLYFADSIGRRIYAYDYELESGTVRNRREFIAIPDEDGIPDGLAVDAEGFLWSAFWYGGCVARFDPDGKRERVIRVPAKQVSSMTFGGPDLTDLFVTTAAQSEPTPAMPLGYDPRTGPFGGALYLIHGDIAGKPEPRCRIRPSLQRGQGGSV